MAIEEPKNKYELVLWQILKEGGWELVKNGWPDILAVKGDRVAVFEVKAKRGDVLKETQLRCMGFLSRADVECYRWDEESGFLPYSEVLPDVKTLNKNRRERYMKGKLAHTCPICGQQSSKSANELACYKCSHDPRNKERIALLQKDATL